MVDRPRSLLLATRAVLPLVLVILAACTGGAVDPAHPTVDIPPAGGAQPEPGDGKLGAKHLLVMYRGSMRAADSITRSKDEARARATEAMNKAKRPGQSFAEVAGAYSDEPGAAERGGDLGKFRRGALVPEFERALLELKVGEISEVVETPFGFHVILRTQ